MSDPAPAATVDAYLKSAEDLAEAAAKLTRAGITVRLRTDPDIEWEPQETGAQLAVLDPDTGLVQSVELNTVADIAWAMTTDEILLPFEQITERFLAPAVQALVTRLECDIRAYKAPEPLFACAPHALPFGAFGAVYTTGGISIRALYQYDMARCAFVASIDMLYGLAVPPARESFAA